ncbi:hypothetical protein Tco_1156433 [Tanacetum coccineum]
MAGSDDENPPPPPLQQTPTQQAPPTVSTIKLHILKKGEYEIWAMKMKHYLSHTDYPIWEVIQKGNGPVSVSTDTNGVIKVLPPKTAEEILARERERKARTTLLMALQEDHLAKFHKLTDAKEMLDAIKSRFKGLHKGYDRFQSLLSQFEIHGIGVSTEDANQKFLRSLPSSWSQVSLVMRTKPGVDSLSFDDLYNNLNVFESDVKGSTGSSSSTQNVAFVSSESTSSTNDLVSAASLINTARPKLSIAQLGWCCSKVFNNGVDAWIGSKMLFGLDLRFWNTASSQTVNDEKQIHATVDSKAVVVTEASIRSSLLLNDVVGTACLTNEAIFQNLALMGYEGELNKLTFQKAFFSPQWKYLIHTILYFLCSKSTSWNKFSTNIASAVICLATNQKFNFSKLIFDGMLRNLDNPKKKFLMYPRFLMVFLNNQIELGEPFNDVYITPAHTLKVFSNMSRKGVKFSGKVTPLFDSMLVPHQAPEGEGSEQPTEPQPTPSPTQPSTGDQPPVTDSSSSHDTTQDSRDSLEGTNGSEGDQVQPSHDSNLSGGPTSDRAKGGMTLEELSVLCTNLSNRVLALEASKDAQAAEIIKLKTRIKKLKKKSHPVISHHKAWLRSVSGLYMKRKLGRKESISKQGRKNAKPRPIMDDSTFDDLDADHGMDSMDREEPVNEGRLSKETEELNVTHDTEVLEKGGSNEKPVSAAGNTGVSTVVLEVSTATPMTPLTTTSVFEDEDIFLADALVMLSDKTKLKGVAIKEVKESDRTERSILTLKPLLLIDPKDKGKGVLKESPVKKVKKSDLDAAQISKNAEVARLVYEEELAELEKEKEER